MTPLEAGLRQPDARSCGAATMVVARALGDPTYARRALAAFGPEVLATHRRLTASRLRGRRQVPWPRALGTPPWAIARELTALSGVDHRVRLVRFGRGRHRLLAEPVRQVGGCVALYVGSRWLPRHVVLVVPGPGPRRCYEPSSGRTLPVDLPRVPLAGWRQAWFAVEPHADPHADPH